MRGRETFVLSPQSGEKEADFVEKETYLLKKQLLKEKENFNEKKVLYQRKKVTQFLCGSIKHQIYLWFSLFSGRATPHSFFPLALPHVFGKERVVFATLLLYFFSCTY